MEKNIIPYEERIIGAIYYCALGENRYILQCTTEGNYFPHIYKRETKKWDVIRTSRFFKSGWEKKTDDEIRLASSKEIELFMEHLGDYEPLPLPAIQQQQTEYQIY